MSAVFRVIDLFEFSTRAMSVLFGSIEQGVITPDMFARFGREGLLIRGLDSAAAANVSKVRLVFGELQADQMVWLRSLRVGALVGIMGQGERWTENLETKVGDGANAVEWTRTEMAFLSQGEVRHGELFLQADAALAALEYALEGGDVLLGIEVFEFRGDDIVVRTDMGPTDETDVGEVSAFFRAQRGKRVLVYSGP